MNNLEEIEQEETLPPRPSPKRKYLLVGVITALAVLIGGAGIFVLLIQQEPQEALVGSVPTRPPIPTPIANVFDTSGWQTYRDEKLGFEVMYPENWKVNSDEGSGLVQIATVDRNLYKTYSDSGILRSPLGEMWINIALFIVNPVERIFEEPIMRFVNSNFVPIQEKNLDLVIINETKVLSAGDRKILIKKSYWKRDSSKIAHEQIFDEIVSSFQFLELKDSALLTYRNEDYGIEFQYPAIYDEREIYKPCRPKEKDGIIGGLEFANISLDIADTEGVTLSKYVAQVIESERKWAEAAERRSFNLAFRETTLVGSKPAEEVQYSIFAGASGDNIHRIYVEMDDKIYVFSVLTKGSRKSCAYEAGRALSSSDTLWNILSTLRFTE